MQKRHCFYIIAIFCSISTSSFANPADPTYIPSLLSQRDSPFVANVTISSGYHYLRSRARVDEDCFAAYLNNPCNNQQSPNLARAPCPFQVSTNDTTGLINIASTTCTNSSNLKVSFVKGTCKPMVSFSSLPQFAWVVETRDSGTVFRFGTPPKGCSNVLLGVKDFSCSRNPSLRLYSVGEGGGREVWEYGRYRMPKPTLATVDLGPYPNATSLYSGATGVYQPYVMLAPSRLGSIGAYNVDSEKFKRIKVGNPKQEVLYAGVAGVGTWSVYVPYASSSIGIVDGKTMQVSKLPTGIKGKTPLFADGAVGSDYNVWMTPVEAGGMGRVKVGYAPSFSLVKFSNFPKVMWPYTQPVAVGNKLILAPSNSPTIGIIELHESKEPTFRSISVKKQLIGNSPYYTFSGAAAVGNKVVFVPWDARVIGIFDVSTEVFETVTLPDPVRKIVTGGKFNGAAAFGRKVYFAPGAAPGVGIFDVKDYTFHMVAVEAKGTYKYRTPAVSEVDQRIYFPPQSALSSGNKLLVLTPP